jgi:hypothetical protein
VTAPPTPTPPPIPVATPAPLDTAPPVFSVAVAGHRLKPVLSRGLTVRIDSGEAGSAWVTIRVDRATARRLGLNISRRGVLVIGLAHRSVPAGRANVSVKLTAPARRALNKARVGVKLRITVTLTDAKDNTAAHVLAVTLTR